MISYIAKSYSIHHMTYRHVGVHGENILHACMCRIEVLTPTTVLGGRA